MRAIGKHLASVLIGTTGAFCTAWALSPERHVPEDELVLLVGDSCPKSLELQRQVAEDPELASRVITLSIDAGSESPNCGRAVDDVKSEAPWLRVFDDAWICRRLNRYAAAMHREHFIGLPAWIERVAPVPPSDEHAALERHGLRMCRGPRLRLADAACPTSQAVAEPSVDAVTVVERAWNIGL